MRRLADQIDPPVGPSTITMRFVGEPIMIADASRAADLIVFDHVQRRLRVQRPTTS